MCRGEMFFKFRGMMFSIRLKSYFSEALTVSRNYKVSSRLFQLKLCHLWLAVTLYLSPYMWTARSGPWQPAASIRLHTAAAARTCRPSAVTRGRATTPGSVAAKCRWRPGQLRCPWRGASLSGWVAMWQHLFCGRIISLSLKKSQCKRKVTGCMTYTHISDLDTMKAPWILLKWLYRFLIWISL